MENNNLAPVLNVYSRYNESVMKFNVLLLVCRCYTLCHVTLLSPSSPYGETELDIELLIVSQP